jgi:hypothetical protein
LGKRCALERVRQVAVLLLWDGKKLCPHRLVVRTSGFQSGNRGSIPLGDAKY